LQKHMPTPTQTATPYTTGPLGVRVGQPDNPSLLENFVLA